MINIVSKSELKKNFTIYGPRFISCTNNNMLIRYLRQDTSIGIECHDILLSAENTEELSVQRKTDLTIVLQPTVSRSAICIPLYTIRNSLICGNGHPRITDISNYEQIIAEEFILLISKSAGIDEIQVDIDERFINRKVLFCSSSLMTITNSISVIDLLGIMSTGLYDLHRNFLKLKEVKLEQPLPTVKLYISHNKVSLNNLIFFRFVGRLNNSF